MADERAERASKAIAGEWTWLSGPSGCVNWPRIAAIITDAYAEQTAELEKARIRCADLRVGKERLTLDCEEAVRVANERAAKLAAAEAENFRFRSMIARDPELVAATGKAVDLYEEKLSECESKLAAAEAQAGAALKLDDYERGNLLSALEAIRTAPPGHPLNPLHSGDWLCQILDKVGAIPTEHKGNKSPEQYISESGSLLAELEALRGMLRTLANELEEEAKGWAAEGYHGSAAVCREQVQRIAAALSEREGRE